MRQHIRPSIANLLIVVVLAGVLALSFAGFTMSMSSSSDGMPSPCPFVGGESSMCPLDLTEHLALWRNWFSAPTPLPMLLVVLLVGCGFWLLRGMLGAQPRIAFMRVGGHTPNVPRIRDPMARALARGVIHSKMH